MLIVEIIALDNGAHRNQDSNLSIQNIPEGWAVVPEDMELENFPFGEVTAEEIDGVMTVTNWVAGVIPEVEPIEEEPSEEDDTVAMLVDHEYRLTLLELGLTV